MPLEYLEEYKKRVKNSRSETRFSIKSGDTIQLYYENKLRILLVINPYYKEMLHAISLVEIPYDVFKNNIQRHRDVNAPNTDAAGIQLYNTLKQTILKYNAFRTYKWDKIFRLESVVLTEEQLEQRELKVWLDDTRFPPPGWAWVKTAPECIDLLKTKKVLDLSLDHDLGEASAGTGYDVVVWIEEKVITEKFVAPNIYIHSANPVGRKNMMRAIESIVEHSV